MNDQDLETAIAPRYWRLSGFGLLVGTLFFAASLTPSLMPRPAVLQGILGGLSAALGYTIGAFLIWLWRAMRLPEADRQAERGFRALLIVSGLIVYVLSLTKAADWQNATLAVLGQDAVDSAHPFKVAAVSLCVFAVLWLGGSAFVYVARRAGAALGRLLPGRTGPVTGLLIAIYLFWAIGDGLLVRRVMQAADASFAAGEQVFDPRMLEPTDPMMTGSDASLVEWDDLGNRGRDFIGRTPTEEEISTFHGPDARTPVRVYVGRVSAETARERAELALQELIRQGGFDRKILIVTTPVGTGWMDPGSHDVVDFMWGGDTAHVAAQYSYLTSILSILTNVEYGFEQSRELFDVIYEYWTTLPPDSRPRLYIHGLSQGALNSQATVPFFNTLADPVDGAFWAGSPFISPIWRHVIDNRAPDSPVWRPLSGNGSLIRVTNQDNVLDDPGFAPWGPIRFVFLSYASDPIVNFDFGTILRAPEWLSEDRPADVSPDMRWYPFVTAFQLALDMTTALGIEGFGHYYFFEDYISAWAELTDPPGWTEAREAELKALFETRPSPW